MRYRLSLEACLIPNKFSVVGLVSFYKVEGGGGGGGIANSKK